MLVVSPVDGFRKDTGALRHGGHGIDVDIRRQRELAANCIAKGLVIRWASDKYNPFDIICRQPCFLHGVSRRTDSFGHHLGNIAVQLAAGYENIKIYLLTVKIHAAGFAFTESDGALVPRRELDLCFFRRPLRKADEGLVLGIRQEIGRKLKMRAKPGNDDIVEYNTVPIPSTAHLDAAVRKEVYLTANVFRNGNIKGPTAEIIDQEYSLCLGLPHDAHHRGDRLLHQCNVLESGHSRRFQRRVFFHLVKCSGHGNNNGRVFRIADIFGEISKQDFQDLRAAFLRGHCNPGTLDLDLRACSHKTLEKSGTVIGVAGGIVISALAVIAVAALVDVNSGRSHIVLIGAFPDTDILTVI